MTIKTDSCVSIKEIKTLSYDKRTYYFNSPLQLQVVVLEQGITNVTAKGFPIKGMGDNFKIALQEFSLYFHLLWLKVLKPDVRLSKEDRELKRFFINTVKMIGPRIAK